MTTLSSKVVTENWERRMAEGTTRVVVHLSTNHGDGPWNSWELQGSPATAFKRVMDHLEFSQRLETLPVGAYTITVPGHRHRHTFEVSDG